MVFTERNNMMQTSLYGRVSKLLESYEWSDCSFSVSGRNFKAHRLIMGISSPVFKAMFYGPLSTSDDIIIADIEPDIFQLLIVYIYTDKVEISCIEHAFELLYAAKKYLLEDLREKCIDYIKANLSVDNVISVLNFSEYIQEDPLITDSLKLFCEHAKYLFNESLENITSSSLKIILESNDINISERDLIVFAFQWAKVTCCSNGVADTFENRRKCLVDNHLFKLLRFSILSDKDLEIILNEDTNAKEAIELAEITKMNICNLNDSSCIKMTRNALKVREHICHRRFLRSSAPLIVDGQNNTIHVKMQVDKTIFINSLCVPTRMSPQINFHSDNAMLYSEQFSVTVTCETDNCIIKSTNFMNTVEYDSNVFIEFSEPCVLQKDKWYVINFSWPSGGCYSNRYIVVQRDVVVHQKVKFHFEDTVSDGSFLESLKFSL